MRRRVTGAAALALVTALPLSPAEASQCPGTRVTYRKVVQDLTGAETTGQQIASGVMGNIYAFDRGLTCVAYANGTENYAVSALHLHLGNVVHNGQTITQFVEGGLYYGGGAFRLFLSHAYVSGGAVHSDTYYSPGVVAAEQWYGFNISPHSVTASGTSFKLQWVTGESQTGWTTVSTTPAIPDGLGTPMVIGARTAHANGKLFARQLKYRPTSGWFSWTHMGCYLGYGGNDPSWDVVKFSETAFYTANQVPEPGGC